MNYKLEGDTRNERRVKIKSATFHQREANDTGSMEQRQKRDERIRWGMSFPNDKGMYLYGSYREGRA